MTPKQAEATGIEAEVCRDLSARQQLGKAKYGVELADNKSSLCARINHAYEESCDQTAYLKWASKEAARLESLVEEFAVALRMLCKCQNGCPLPEHEERWHDAMERAEVALAKLPHP